MTTSTAPLPARFRDIDHLEEVMTTPAPALVEDMNRLDGDMILLGVGGKIGPTLARRARRGAPRRGRVGGPRGADPGLGPENYGGG